MWQRTVVRVQKTRLGPLRTVSRRLRTTCRGGGHARAVSNDRNRLHHVGTRRRMGGARTWSEAAGGDRFRARGDGRQERGRWPRAAGTVGAASSSPMRGARAMRGASARRSRSTRRSCSRSRATSMSRCAPRRCSRAAVIRSKHGSSSARRRANSRASDASTSACRCTTRRVAGCRTSTTHGGSPRSSR